MEENRENIEESIKEELGMTDEQFAMVFKLIVTLIEQCETKEEAIEKIKQLDIMRNEA